jgi:hypothetical protein
MKKQGIEFGFSWIFAIIVGSVILFIAIYAVVQLGGTEKRVAGTFVSAELDSLLNPLETNLEDVKYAQIKFDDDVKIFNECRSDGNFGTQGLAISLKIGEDKWGDKGIPKTSGDKYVFSRKEETGDKSHVITKPFEMPYKVGDLIFMNSGKYCFVNPPSEIEEEIDDLSIGGENDIGIEIKQSERECSSESKVVCFNKIGCDIVVNTVNEVVIKNGEDLYYEDSLIYGAIFSDKDVYECQVKRLHKRISHLALIYNRKNELMQLEGCASNLGSELQNFANIKIINSKDFVERVVPTAKEIGRKNDAISRCKVF